MIESIWFTQAGLGLDFVGATLVALDLFFSQKNFDEYCESCKTKWGDKLVDTLSYCEIVEKKLKNLNKAQAFLEETKLKFKLKRDFLFITMYGNYIKFNKKIENPRKLGFAFIALGFFLQFVATFISNTPPKAFSLLVFLFPLG